ncbi:MAG: DUF2141 domain-containing protein [Nostocales cyanobacterium]|nr:MAG: DUF2141 domain-containing protein [Nostocales cyanobacterium]TAF13957.1 MAG: DUF2141 domain-containing protein [Nostocales cyanobacterium]
MSKLSDISLILLSTFLGCMSVNKVHAENTSSLTVIVNGIRHKTGDICFRVYDSEKGFPHDSASEVKSGCTKITGNSVKQVFSGLKPGKYAVAVIDDQNGDRQLNKDFFGIPKEGFGISRNPIVSMQTGTPKFRHTSFPVTKNTTININMKYSLDP